MSDEDAQLNAKISKIAEEMRSKKLDDYNLASLLQIAQPQLGLWSPPATRVVTLAILEEPDNDLKSNIQSVLRHRHPSNFLLEVAKGLLNKYDLHKPPFEIIDFGEGGAGPSQPGPATSRKIASKPSMGGAAAEEVVNLIDSDDEEKPSEKSGKRFLQAQVAFQAAKAARDAAEAEYERDLNDEEERAAKRPRA